MFQVAYIDRETGKRWVGFSTFPTQQEAERKARIFRRLQRKLGHKVETRVVRAK